MKFYQLSIASITIVLLTACGGGGANINTEKTPVTVVPIPIAKTSYENFKGIGINQTTFPEKTGWLKWGDTTNAYGFADFFQRGKRDIFTTTINYSNEDNYYTVKSDTKVYSDMEFWHINDDGTYTKKLSYKGCLHPRKALIADFNNDGLPDVFVGCIGWDGPPPIGNFYWAGEKSKLLLNDGKGGFTVIDVGSDNYIHGASAADVNGDGWIDIVVADVTHSWYGQNIYVLINNKDGTFTKDSTRFPATHFSSLYVSVELIDVNSDGYIDALIGSGFEHHGDPTLILYGDSRGKFGSNGNSTVIPAIGGRGVVLDFTLIKDSNGYKQLFVGRTSDTTSLKYYFTNTIQKFDPVSKKSDVIYDMEAIVGSWVAWWMPLTTGSLGITPYTNINKGTLLPILLPIGP